MRKVLAVLMVAAMFLLPCQAMAASGDFGPGVSADDGTWQGSWSTSFTNNYLSVNIASFATFVRIPNVTIPNGATITAAYFTYTSSLNVSTACSGLIAFDDVDDAVAPTNQSELNTMLASTTTGITEVYASHVTGTNYNTSSLVSDLQEVVDRAGWASGQAVMLFFEYSSGSNRRMYTWDYSGTKTLNLHVEWTAASGYPNDFGGVASANIGSVGGTDVANIGKIGGTE